MAERAAASAGIELKCSSRALPTASFIAASFRQGARSKPVGDVPRINASGMPGVVGLLRK
eukprot:5048261-Pyramimonas_sp.AAC.1